MKVKYLKEAVKNNKGITLTETTFKGYERVFYDLKVFEMTTGKKVIFKDLDTKAEALKAYDKAVKEFHNA